ncbi:hypothetical protein DUGA6_26540 [Duganella sp. HH105]|nr:hypothetical protein DUGA6_26540 [Duganella sp. HH105]
MSAMNKQQLCAALDISESTVRRREQLGMPYTPVGKRSHRYDLEECKSWLKANLPGDATTKPRAAVGTMQGMALAGYVRQRPLPKA